MYTYKVLASDEKTMISTGNFFGTLKEMDKLVDELSKQYSNAYIIRFYDFFIGENSLPYEYQL